MREDSLRRCLPSIADKIKSARVLMVGAGGIGCELLKNLVLTGFGEVHLLDLDTIDLSNLNRQFLFQKQHIKKSKALVAKTTATKFNPHVKLEAYHANIKDADFNVLWFKQFDIVFNALDNLDARRHVNKMCLAADIPLIESGTTGFRGQVQVIVRGKTECYDCNPKEVPKSFPICTIRSTPSQPIHCIVWAKSYLFSQVFGVDEDETVLDQTADSDNKDELDNLRKEANALQVIREAMGTPEFPKLVFDKVFKDDVNRLRSMEEMWKSRTPPDALTYDDLVNSADETPSQPWLDDQALWTLYENVRVFQDSITRLSVRLKDLQAAQIDSSSPQAALSFDKDDVDTLDFVAATANIRAHIFGIDKKTKFDIKQMAGNIIAAIATTNAIIAGVCVLQSFKILKEDLTSTKTVFLSRRPERVFNNESSAKPNPDCSICGVAQIVLEADVSRMTLRDLVDSVLKEVFQYTDELSILTKDLIYDPDFDDNLDKVLKDLSIIDGTFLTIIDDDENEDGQSRVNLNIIIQNFESSESSFKTPSAIDIPYKQKRALEPEPDTIVQVVPEANGSTEKRKRTREDEEEADLAESEPKRKKVFNPEGEDVLVINDGDEIVID